MEQPGGIEENRLPSGGERALYVGRGVVADHQMSRWIADAAALHRMAENPRVGFVDADVVRQHGDVDQMRYSGRGDFTVLHIGEAVGSYSDIQSEFAKPFKQCERAVYQCALLSQLRSRYILSRS